MFGYCVITLGFTFSEIKRITASSNKVECCHFSSDGKLLATGGHDKKVRTKDRNWISFINCCLKFLIKDSANSNTMCLCSFQKNNDKSLAWWFCGAGCIMVHRVFYSKVYSWRTYSMDYRCSLQSKHVTAGYIFSWQNCQGLGYWKCQ